MLTNPSKAALFEAISRVAQSDEVLDWYDAQLTATLRHLNQRLPSLRGDILDEELMQNISLQPAWSRGGGVINLNVQLSADVHEMLENLSGINIVPHSEGIFWVHTETMCIDWIKVIFTIQIDGMYTPIDKELLISLGKIETYASPGYFTQRLTCSL